MNDELAFYENSPSAVWDVVVTMVEEGRTPSRRPEDEVYRKGYHFLKRAKYATGIDRVNLRRDYPTLFAAYMLFNDPRSERWIIEAGLLTGIPLDILSKYVAQPIPVIEEYHKYFFNVKDRLESRGYILNQVLTPAFARGMHQRDYDMMFKTMAYCMGWQVFIEFIDRRELTSNTRSILGLGFRDNLMRLGYMATQRLELNNFNAHIVIELCLRLAELEANKGVSNGREEAMSLLNNLIAQCKTAILPLNTVLLADEPRAEIVMTGAPMLSYKKETENGKNE